MTTDTLQTWSTGIPTYPVLPLCINPGTHHFTLAYPKWGEQGKPMAVCTRCGMVKE